MYANPHSKGLLTEIKHSSEELANTEWFKGVKGLSTDKNEKVTGIWLGWFPSSNMI